MFPLALAIPLAVLPIASLAGTLRWMAVSARTAGGLRPPVAPAE
jgi:hypothetical protein